MVCSMSTVCIASNVVLRKTSEGRINIRTNFYLTFGVRKDGAIMTVQGSFSVKANDSRGKHVLTAPSSLRIASRE